MIDAAQNEIYKRTYDMYSPNGTGKDDAIPVISAFITQMTQEMEALKETGAAEIRAGLVGMVAAALNTADLGNDIE